MRLGSILRNDERSVFGDACVRGLVGQPEKRKDSQWQRAAANPKEPAMLVEKVIDLLMD
jgi:hypothetical protein